MAVVAVVDGGVQEDLCISVGEQLGCFRETARSWLEVVFKFIRKRQKNLR